MHVQRYYNLFNSMESLCQQVWETHRNRSITVFCFCKRMPELHAWWLLSFFPTVLWSYLPCAINPNKKNEAQSNQKKQKVTKLIAVSGTYKTCLQNLFLKLSEWNCNLLHISFYLDIKLSDENHSQRNRHKKQARKLSP